MIIIYDIRRVGKTSLLKVALNEVALPYAYVDVMGIYDRSGNVSPSLLMKDLVDTFKGNLAFYERVKFDIKETLKNIKGFRFRDVGIELVSGARVDLHDVLKRIDEWCTNHGIRFILALDKAQYLLYLGSICYCSVGSSII